MKNRLPARASVCKHPRMTSTLLTMVTGYIRGLRTLLVLALYVISNWDRRAADRWSGLSISWVSHISSRDHS